MLTPLSARCYHSCGNTSLSWGNTSNEQDLRMTFTLRNDVQDDWMHCFSLWRCPWRPSCRSERALRGLVHPLRRVARPARLCTKPPPSATSTAPFRPLRPHLDTAAVHDDGEARGGRRERIASAAKHGEQVVGQPHLRYWLYSRSRRPRRSQARRRPQPPSVRLAHSRTRYTRPSRRPTTR